jgi:hypothetical protein
MQSTTNDPVLAGWAFFFGLAQKRTKKVQGCYSFFTFFFDKIAKHIETRQVV